MKKRNLVLVILAVLLVFGMVMSCGPAEDDGTGGTTGGGDVSVTLSGVTQDGSLTTKATTQLTLTFSRAVTGLTADDITLSGVAGVTKGTVGGSGTSWTLGISGFSAGGNLSVAVAKTGYKFSGSPKSVTIYAAIDIAKAYFGEYKTTYTLSGAQTNESVTVNPAGNTLTIEEISNGTSIDKLVFAINSWEVVPVPNDVVDPSAETDSTVFKFGFKIKGKITSSTPGYVPSNKTSKGFVMATDVGANTTTESWVYIWVADYFAGKKLVRSPFSKSSVAGATGNNEDTHFVTGSTDVIRVYKMEEDD